MAQQGLLERSREATVDYERLAREIVEFGLETDAEENDRLGERRGDELPPEVATSAGRRQWFKEARRWLDDERAEQAAPIPRDRPKRVQEAKRRLDEQLIHRDAPGAGLSAVPRSRCRSPRRATGAEHGPATIRPAAGPGGHDQHH